MEIPFIVRNRPFLSIVINFYRGEYRLYAHNPFTKLAEGSYPDGALFISKI